MKNLKGMQNSIRTTVFLVVAIFILVISSFAASTAASNNNPMYQAAPGSTLADVLESVIRNVTWNTADSWTAAWGPILAGENGSALDVAMTQDLNAGRYTDALYVARIADIDNYTSTTLSSATRTALQQQVMVGSLPATSTAQFYGDPNTYCFLVYQRFILWSYEYAQRYALAGKWNATKAFSDFAELYDLPPRNSAFGEMLFADPQTNWAYSCSSRYYDECAETLSVFLKFAELGVPGAMTYADKVWAGLQNHWNGQFYVYTTDSEIVECEMGNFAQVIAEYAQEKGGTQNVPNWNRVTQDLSYKLLSNGWSSPGWASPGVIVHANSNSQTRLGETMGAMMALQEFYPRFTPVQQITLQNMLMGANCAWQGLISSNLYFNGQFGVVGGSLPSNDGTINGAATLFLDGIVPITGNLAIPNREENYNDFRTQFPYSQFQFDYGHHKIRIPVNKGQLTFIYGIAPVSYDFTADGVYDIQFSTDWNQIISVNKQSSHLPSVPRNLVATAGNARVKLSWSAPMSNGGFTVTNYTIYRGNTAGAETVMITIGTNLSYTDTKVTNGKTYYYKVTATNAAGKSGFSNEAKATPLPTLKITLTTDKTSYPRGAYIKVNATVQNSANGIAIVNASVKVTIKRSNGQILYTSAARTGSTGRVTFTYKIPSNATIGSYLLVVTVSATGYLNGTKQISFYVS